MTTPLDLARLYLSRGWMPLPVPFKEKNPGFNNWQNFTIDEETIGRYFNGHRQNIGILLGSPSHDLTDADLDIPEAIVTAAFYLPETGAKFGRIGKPNSHCLYYCDPPLKTQAFIDPTKRKNEKYHKVLELRSTGAQTVFPGSVHETGERITWSSIGEPATLGGDELIWYASRAAAAALLARHWPGVGTRHDASLALCGGLLSSGWTEETTRDFLEITLTAAGDEERQDRLADVETTARRIRERLTDSGKLLTSWSRLAEVVDPKVVGSIKTWLKIRDPHLTKNASGGLEESALPEINADDGNLPRVTALAWEAVTAANDPPRLFQYSDLASRVAIDQESGYASIQPLDEDRLRHAAALAARWYHQKIDRRTGELKTPDAFPPLAVIRNMLAQPSVPLPRLRRVVEHPVFTQKGTLADKPGYHPDGQVFYAPAAGFVVPPIPLHPTTQDVLEAKLLLLDDLLADFPFCEDADETHALCFFLHPLARDLIDGPTPLFDFEKPMAGTGATLLTLTLASVVTGHVVEMTTMPKDDEEMRKKLTALYMRGAAHILIDNVRDVVDLASLASAVTSSVWEDRELGRSRTIRAPILATHAMTANNPSFSGEMSRRIVRIRLDAKVDDPSQRSAFKHEELLRWALDNRGRLVAAGLTIIRAWLDAGRPRSRTPQTMGMFESWARVMGGILDHAGMTDFLGNKQRVQDEGNSELGAWRIFIRRWWDLHGKNPVASSVLLLLADGVDGFEVAGKDDSAKKTTFGLRLRGAKDRVFTLVDADKVSFQVTLKAAGEANGSKLWKLSDVV